MHTDAIHLTQIVTRTSIRAHVVLPVVQLLHVHMYTNLEKERELTSIMNEVRGADEEFEDEGDSEIEGAAAGGDRVRAVTV